MTFPPKRPSPSSHPALARPSNVRDALREAHAVGGAPVSRPSAFAQQSTRKTLLLVDPDTSLRARLRSLLELQYEILEANDGMEAVEITSTIQPPAMIIAETVMPRVDGFTMAKILRNNPVMRRVPIMFVSTQHGPQHVTQALVIGVTQYLPKTTPVAQIVEKIRKLVV